MEPLDPHRYDDMLDLPHPVSATHAHMSALDRAAQFSAFAALTGYHDAIDETGRFTESYDVPDELRQLQLNESLCLLQAHLHEDPQVRITFFCPDDAKGGGKWLTVDTFVRKIDLPAQALTLANNDTIPFAYISEIESEIF